MTRVGLGTTCYPSPDNDTCRVGCEPRVQSITAWREKKPSYKGKLNRICRGTFFITAHCLGCVHFSTVLQSIFFSEFWVFVSLTWASERHRPQRRHRVFCRFWERLLWCGGEGHVAWSWWGRSWRGNALALGQPAGTASNTSTVSNTSIASWYDSNSKI